MENFINRHPNLLLKTTTGLLIIDIQEKVLKVMKHPEQVLTNTIKLIQGFKVLRLPIFYTEQYPKGLGETVQQIKDELSGYKAFQKLSFSCYGAEDLFIQLKKENLFQVVVAGIESHVCVQQTVMDLLANNFQVNLAADAVSSRKEIDYNIGLERMRQIGTQVTTTESVLFELLNVCGTDEFRQISKIVK